jgi:SAM-dependent methyltransferase
MSVPWYLEYLACPDCGGDCSAAGASAACPGCGRLLDCSQRPVDLRPRKPAPATLVCPRQSAAPAVVQSVPLDKPVVSYDGPMPGRDSRELVSAMLPFLPTGAKVLDLGCGPRDQAAVFGHLGCKYVGLDLSNTAADILADAHVLPFRSETFDAVFSYAVLQHLYNPFVAVTEIKRVLKPGGVYCGTVAQGSPFQDSYFNVTSWGLVSLVETSGMKIERLWSSYDTLRALAEVGRYPRAIKPLIRAVDILHTRLPFLSFRKALRWSAHEKALDRLHRSAGICFLIRKPVGATSGPH